MSNDTNTEKINVNGLTKLKCYHIHYRLHFIFAETLAAYDPEKQLYWPFF